MMKRRVLWLIPLAIQVIFKSAAAGGDLSYLDVPLQGLVSFHLLDVVYGRLKDRGVPAGQDGAAAGAAANARLTIACLHVADVGNGGSEDASPAVLAGRATCSLELGACGSLL